MVIKINQGIISAISGHMLTLDPGLFQALFSAPLQKITLSREFFPLLRAWDNVKELSIRESTLDFFKGIGKVRNHVNWKLV